MGDQGEDGMMGDERSEAGAFDGSGLVQAFQRAWQRVDAPPDAVGRERAERVLEAAAYASALELIGRLSSIPPGDRAALASTVRRTLLTLAGLAQDEDERDALELAARYARDGLRALSGATSRAHAPGEGRPPPARELVRFIRGALDGFASADVANRLRGSRRGLEELARYVPSVVVSVGPRIRVAADSVGSRLGVELRDPAAGRLLASLALDAEDGGHEAGAVEAVLFPDDVVALYADPPRILRAARQEAASDGAERRGGPTSRVQSRIVDADLDPVGLRGMGGAGYVELQIHDWTRPVTLSVAYGERTFEWTLSDEERDGRT